MKTVELTEFDKVWLRKRFEENSMPVPPATCKLWLGAPVVGGYGRIRIHGVDVRVHRLVFFVANGWWPLVVRHSCDVTCCIQESHLLGGTNQDNVDDRDARGRTAKGDRHWTRTRPELIVRMPGELHGRAKLTAADILTIRGSVESQSVLAQWYGVSQSHISTLQLGKAWKHLGQDGVRKSGEDCFGRLAGEQHYRAKLTEVAVREIRLSLETAAALAERLGVDRVTIEYVRCRKIWKHVVGDLAAEQLAEAERRRLYPRTKLTDQQVREIRASSERGLPLSRRLGISSAQVYSIRNGTSRTDVA